MIKIEDALDLINNLSIRRQTDIIGIDDALTYSLAQEVVAPMDLPPFDNSAMDGYAVSGIHEQYRIVGRSQAGEGRLLQLESGAAFRIYTGAPLPEGTTSVIMQEQVEVEDDILKPHQQVVDQKHIRRAGKQIHRGSKVFDVGTYMNEASIGILASLGIRSIHVYRKPKIAIVLTGNELIKPGQPLRYGQIYESNSYAIKTALERFGHKCTTQYIVKDQFEETKTTIAAALSKHDIVLISGGISVGDFDFVHQALKENDINELFYKVYQKPGKPLFFGRHNDKFVFALPGNPASSLSCLYIYVLEFLGHFCGQQHNKGLKRLSLPIKHDYINPFNRPTFLKAQIVNSKVKILDGQSSSMIYALSEADLLVLIQEDQSCKEGDLVNCWLL